MLGHETCGGELMSPQMPAVNGSTSPSPSGSARTEEGATLWEAFKRGWIRGWLITLGIRRRRPRPVAAPRSPEDDIRRLQGDVERVLGDYERVLKRYKVDAA